MRNSDPTINPNPRTSPIAGASSWIAVFYVNSTFPGYFNLKAEISSDGWTYWIDSIKVNVITGVEDEVDMPSAFKLERNFPDPFNLSTKIQYSLSSQQNAIIKVFDILGNEIETLVNEEKPAGTYEVILGKQQTYQAEFISIS